MLGFHHNPQEQWNYSLMKAINMIIVIWMEYIWGNEYKCKSTTRVWNYNQGHKGIGDGDGVYDDDDDGDRCGGLQDPSPSLPRAMVMEI